MDNTIRETTNLTADIVDGGAQRVMMHAALCAGERMEIIVNLLDAEYCAAHADDVRAKLSAFVLGVCKRAGRMSIPIDLPGGDGGD